MERTDKITVEPMKIDGREQTSTEICLKGDAEEVALIAAGLTSLKSALDTSQSISGPDNRATHEVIDRLISEIESPVHEVRVELGPEAITEGYLQELTRQHL